MESKNTAEQEIRDLEELLLKPETRKSKDVLLRLLADDFFEIVASGRRYNREQIIEALLQEIPEPLSMTDFHAKPIGGGLVLATYRAIQGTRDVSLRSSIWKFTDNRWQIIFHQGTPVIDKCRCD